jgi:hypothetical protein
LKETVLYYIEDELLDMSKPGPFSVEYWLSSVEEESRPRWINKPKSGKTESHEEVDLNYEVESTISDEAKSLTPQYLLQLAATRRR